MKQLTPLLFAKAPEDALYTQTWKNLFKYTAKQK